MRDYLTPTHRLAHVRRQRWHALRDGFELAALLALYAVILLLCVTVR